MLSLPGHSQMSEETEKPSCASGNSKAAFHQEEALQKSLTWGLFWDLLREPASGRGFIWGAAHLGARGHGDVQVAENVLGVLILHCLAQK